MIKSNSSAAKLNPLEKLTNEQEKLVEQIERFVKKHLENDNPAVFVLFGDAGTGKSYLLNHLFFRFQSKQRQEGDPLAGRHNYFLVNHPELLKVYRGIAGQYQQLLKKDFQRPTSFINRSKKSGQKADLVVIDEAHLLLSKPDPYNNFYGEDQLSEIIKLSKVLVIVFDQKQIIKTKDYWTKESLLKLISPYPKQIVELKQQYRMQAGPQLIKWINDLTSRRVVGAIQADFRRDFDFRIFADAEQMRKLIYKRNQQVGLCRIVSTTGYPSILDGKKHYIREGDFCMPWDQYNYRSLPWAEIPETIDQVGSVYTCQGFDLNYVGLILGPPILLKDKDKIAVDLDKVTNKEPFQKRADLKDGPAFIKAKEDLVLNTVNILMKRGMKGLYIYAHDPDLRRLLYQKYAQVFEKSDV
ncbi:DUF2075 domain-containing protein [Oenococcus alcoholitolerans]|uniref:DUF2075 domain-containing protein n=1 Tax=Oenococcus alcoholitolerans TaxID=931074 RepID=UPI003F6F3D18